MDAKDMVGASCAGAVIAGGAEYVMTGGESGFSPLWAGVIGGVLGPLIYMAWQRVSNSFPSRVKNWRLPRPRMLLRRLFSRQTGDHPKTATENLPEVTPLATTAPDKAGEWISEDEALKLIRRSSLTRLRLPNETMTIGEALVRRMSVTTSPTASEIRADEIASYLLARYNDQGSWTNRDGRYYKQYLEEWINEEVYGDYEATRSR